MEELILHEDMIEIFCTLKIKDKAYKSVRDAAEAVPKGKFIALNAYIRKEKRSKTNNLYIYLKKPEKEK